MITQNRFMTFCAGVFVALLIAQAMPDQPEQREQLVVGRYQIVGTQRYNDRLKVYTPEYYFLDTATGRLAYCQQPNTWDATHEQIVSWRNYPMIKASKYTGSLPLPNPPATTGR